MLLQMLLILRLSTVRAVPPVITATSATIARSTICVTKQRCRPRAGCAAVATAQDWPNTRHMPGAAPKMMDRSASLTKIPSVSSWATPATNWFTLIHNPNNPNKLTPKNPNNPNRFKSEMRHASSDAMALRSHCFPRKWMVYAVQRTPPAAERPTMTVAVTQRRRHAKITRALTSRPLSYLI